MASEFSKYHFIYNNNVDSNSYEIRKIINGDIYAVLYSKNTDSILAISKMYIWKIDKEGYIVDTFFGTNSLRRSGIQLSSISWTDKHNQAVHHWYKKYSDWLYSGNKTEYTITNIDESKKSSDKDLLNRFSHADIVEFYTTQNSGKKDLKIALLKEKDHWTAINITDRLGEIDEDCDEFKNGEKEIYRQSCMRGFRNPNKYSLQPLENKMPYLFSVNNNNIPLLIRKFKKQKYFYEEGFGLWVLGKTVGKVLKSQGIPGELPDSYWCGTGYIDFKFRSEVFHFKAFVTQEKGEPEIQRLSLYEPPQSTGWDTAFLQLSYIGGDSGVSSREEELRQYQEKDVGLYVIRKKHNSRRQYQNPSTNNHISSEQPKPYRLKNPWFPEFSGLIQQNTARDYTWGDIQFFNTSDTYHYLLSPAFVKSNLHSIPKTLSVDWDGGNILSSYKLYFGDNQYVWLDLNRFAPRAHFNLLFDETESANAFKQLDTKTHAMKLDINIVPIEKAIGKLTITLRNNNKEYKFHHFNLKTESPNYTESETENKRNQIQFEKGKLYVQNREIQQNPIHISDYLELVNTLVDNSPYANEYASIITAHAAKLLFDQYNDKNYKTAKRIFYDFVNHLMPKLSITQQTNDDDVSHNVSVFASYGLIMSSETDDPAIGKTVFQKLMGDNFDFRKINDPISMYNLACYYSRHNQKALMLKAMNESLKLGRPYESFKTDSDFKAFWNDQEFNEVLKEYQHSKSQ